MSDRKLVFWFEELNKKHKATVGKKCAHLGEMIRMGLQVPSGFALSINFYREFIRVTRISDQLNFYVKKCRDLKGADIKVYEKLSDQLRGVIENHEMPLTLKELISDYYYKLCEKNSIENLAVSVRSAGSQSRPGLFESHLNVSGIDNVLDNVKKVWSSAYTARAIAFRANQGLAIIGDELGVGIPKMVNARASGIAFTVNPVDGDTSRILLEANWGLGEGVVSGAQSVDGFALIKENLTISDRRIGKKSKCVKFTDSGTGWTDVPGNMRRIPCVTDYEILEIARVAKSIEKRLGAPQDIEWAIDQESSFPNGLFWLQVRHANVGAKKTASPIDRQAE